MAPDQENTHAAIALKEAHGGHWGQATDHPVAEWQQEVSNDDTRLGYWEWIAARKDEQIAMVKRAADAILAALSAKPATGDKP